MKEPISPNEVPPGGWRWQHPETGFVVRGSNWGDLTAKIRVYLGNNNFPIPGDLDQVVLAWLDEEIQEQAAKAGLPPVKFLANSEPPTFSQKVRTFTHSMGEWVKAGAQVVSMEQLEARQAECSTCSYWRGAHVYGLGSCAKCGCTGLKLYLKTTKCPIGRW